MSSYKQEQRRAFEYMAIQILHLILLQLRNLSTVVSNKQRSLNCKTHFYILRGFWFYFL